MKEIFKIIKEHFIILIGTGLFTYGLFSFKGDGHISRSGFIINDGVAMPLYYYYDESGLFLLTIGAILIVIGLLKIRAGKNKN